MTQAPGDSSRWFVVGKLGSLRVFDNNATVSTSSEVINMASRINATCSECGLLGMAFHPDFPNTPRVYLSYTSAEHLGSGPDSVVSEFTTHDGGRTLDPDSERVILRIMKNNEHHHGGRIMFGRDGFLYIGIGDGNSAANDYAQRLTTLLGKMIRIDINGTTGSALYRIPSDNPYSASTEFCGVNGFGTQNCPEIYALGFRNPWGWGFDSGTGDLWVGDVGETDIEEVSRVERGGNYGWRCYEGTQDMSGKYATGAACASKTGMVPPIAQYPHTIGGTSPVLLAQAASSIAARRSRRSSAAMSSAISRTVGSGTFRTTRRGRSR